jgi:hypothetical protein
VRPLKNPVARCHGTPKAGILLSEAETPDTWGGRCYSAYFFEAVTLNCVGKMGWEGEGFEMQGQGGWRGGGAVFWGEATEQGPPPFPSKHRGLPPPRHRPRPRGPRTLK